MQRIRLSDGQPAYLVALLRIVGDPFGDDISVFIQNPDCRSGQFLAVRYIDLLNFYRYCLQLVNQVCSLFVAFCDGSVQVVGALQLIVRILGFFYCISGIGRQPPGCLLFSCLHVNHGNAVGEVHVAVRSVHGRIAQCDLHLEAFVRIGGTALGQLLFNGKITFAACIDVLRFLLAFGDRSVRAFPYSIKLGRAVLFLHTVCGSHRQILRGLGLAVLQREGSHSVRERHVPIVSADLVPVGQCDNKSEFFRLVSICRTLDRLGYLQVAAFPCIRVLQFCCVCRVLGYCRCRAVSCFIVGIRVRLLFRYNTVFVRCVFIPGLDECYHRSRRQIADRPYIRIGGRSDSCHAGHTYRQVYLPVRCAVIVCRFNLESARQTVHPGEALLDLHVRCLVRIRVHYRNSRVRILRYRRRNIVAIRVVRGCPIVYRVCRCMRVVVRIHRRLGDRVIAHRNAFQLRLCRRIQYILPAHQIKVI